MRPRPHGVRPAPRAQTGRGPPSRRATAPRRGGWRCARRPSRRGRRARRPSCGRGGRATSPRPRARGPRCACSPRRARTRRRPGSRRRPRARGRGVVWTRATPRLATYGCKATVSAIRLTGVRGVDMKAAVTRRYGPPEVVTVRIGGRPHGRQGARPRPRPRCGGHVRGCPHPRGSVPAGVRDPGATGARPAGATEGGAGMGLLRCRRAGRTRCRQPGRGGRGVRDDRHLDGCPRRAGRRQGGQGRAEAAHRLARRRGRAPLRRHDREALPGRPGPAGDHGAGQRRLRCRRLDGGAAGHAGRSRGHRCLRAHERRPRTTPRCPGSHRPHDDRGAGDDRALRRRARDRRQPLAGGRSTPARAGRHAGARRREARRHRPSPR